MMCLGEMTTWLPLSGAIGQLMAQFVDESLGFAIGWNQWYNVSIGQCAEISAAVALVNYWDDTTSVCFALKAI
jgi:amino acid transporter